MTGGARSLNSPLREGWLFYAVLIAAAAIAAALVLIPNAPLVFIVLIVNVIAVLAMPPAIVFLMLLVNDREIMGEHANGPTANFFGISRDDPARPSRARLRNHHHLSPLAPHLGSSGNPTDSQGYTI